MLPIIDDRLVIESHQISEDKQDEFDCELIVGVDPADQNILPEALREKIWRTHHRSQHLRYVTPAFGPDLYDLPPTWIDVGREEVFRGQAMKYATRLMDAGNETELHILKGDCCDFDSLHKPQTKLPQAYKPDIPSRGPSAMKGSP